ncbi:uncharacterized protein LY89DRAFT_743192 [Mollisia scopiformis]|uniref:BTB domain-containing protein n=1 Tax=Mollisia scopiformis TaxID=149040 RepID=A0A132B468_MOLSC|nr:uncharacterized protein LY89DRAFT_743192 [Mollisia scopiformis]KUJ07192.1 hypothetical protein LY89DRAFT_743192 [Mollisia scopiformis]
MVAFLEFATYHYKVINMQPSNTRGLDHQPTSDGTKLVHSFFKTNWGDVICFIIGPSKKVYRIHKDRLCRKIPSLLSIIAQRESEMEAPDGEENDNVSERADKDAEEDSESDLGKHQQRETASEPETHLGEEIIIKFLDQDTASFDILMKWVYHDTLPSLKADYGQTSFWNWDPYAFYTLVDKFELPELKDKVMSSLQASQAKTKQWHKIEQLDWVWARTSPGCGMRRYLAMCMVRNILVYKDPIHPNPQQRMTISTQKISQVLSKYPDLLLAVVDAMRGNDGVKVTDPREVNPCEFHEHWPRKTCGYGKGFEDVEQDVRNDDRHDQDLEANEEYQKKSVRFS